MWNCWGDALKGRQMWYPRWESKTVPDFNRTVSSHPMLRYPWAFLTIFSFHSPLPLTDIVLWATMKAGGPTGAERETGNSGYSLWDTCTIQHVHPNLSPSAGYPTFGLAWLQLSLGWSSNLRCPLKIPLPSGLNLNVSTIYRSCFDLTLLYFPASLAIITQLCLCASFYLNFSPSPEHITLSLFPSTNVRVLNTCQVLGIQEMNRTNKNPCFPLGETENS